MPLHPKEYTKEQWDNMSDEQKLDHKRKRVAKAVLKYDEVHREQKRQYNIEYRKKQRQMCLEYKTLQNAGIIPVNIASVISAN
jgi:hypothetical protein